MEPVFEGYRASERLLNMVFQLQSLSLMLLDFSNNLLLLLVVFQLFVG